MDVQSILDTRAQIQAAFGTKSIRTANQLEKFTVIPTGIFILDLMLLGGFAECTGNQVFGWESSSKTTNCYRAVGQYQKKYPHKRVGWIDLDPMGFQQEWAIACGCDPSRIELVQPPDGESAVDCADILGRTKEIGFIVVDGISGFVSKKMIDEAAEDHQVSYIAKNAGKFASKMRIAMMERAKLGDKLTVLSTNQWRFKISMFGDPRTLPGGTQIKFFNNVALELAAKPFNSANKKDVSKTDAYEGTATATKTKCPSGIRQGAYIVITDPQHPLGYGTVDEADTIITYAGITGVMEGKAPRLSIPVYGATFKTKDELTARLRTDDAFNLFVRQAALANWRKMKGLSLFPNDGYLAGGYVKGGEIKSPVAATAGPPRPGGPPNTPAESHVIGAAPIVPVLPVKLKIPLRPIVKA